MMRKIRVIAALALPVLLQLATPAAVPAQDRSLDSPALEEASESPFTGQWVLNTEASDDPARAMRPARPQGGGRGGGMRGMGGGRGGGMGGGRPGGLGGGQKDLQEDGEPSVQMQQQQARMLKRISRLDIFFAEPELNITDGLDVSRLTYTDGRETTLWTEQGEITATASRQGDTLTVKTRAGQGGPEQERHFTLAEGGNRLTVVSETVRPGLEEPLKVTLVYDRAP